MLVTRCIPHIPHVQMYITRRISIQVETASGNGRQWHSKIQDLARLLPTAPKKRGANWINKSEVKKITKKSYPCGHYLPIPSGELT